MLYSSLPQIKEVKGLVSAYLLSSGVFFLLLSFRYGIPFLKKLLNEQEEEEDGPETDAQRVNLKILSELSAWLAHEVNNPMAIIFGHICRLRRLQEKEGLSNEELESSLRKIEKTGRRIQRITSTLIRYAQTDKVEFRAVNVNDLIHQVKDMFSTVMKKNSIEFDINNELTQKEIQTSELQVEQILFNLISNAQTAVENLKNQRWVRVDINESGGLLVFKVTNSGQKINEKLVKDLIVPFTAGQGQQRATGIGLPLSYHMAKDIGGELGFDAKSNHTCFVLKIPLDKVALAKAA